MDKVGESRELEYSIEALFDFGDRNAKDRRIQKDVFATAEFGVKACSNLDERHQPASNGDISAVR